MKKLLLLAFVLVCTSISSPSQVITENTQSIITFDDQGFTDTQSIGNPYSITNNGETFTFTITPSNSSQTTSHRYQTQENSCSSSGLSHITAGTVPATSWTIETSSGNEINLGTVRFDNPFSCFSFSYSLTIEGFKDNLSTGTQSFTVAGINSIFTPNSNFDDVDKIVISATDLGNLGIDDINWESVAPTTTTPTVTTTIANTIANTSVTLAGEVTDNGGATVTERGIVYSQTSENSDPIIGGTGVISDTNGSGTGVFSESISGLVAGTQYSFKAYATNSEGTSYGAVSTFTTTGKGWTGATNTDWATSSNWSPNSVPIATDNVVIHNATNQPIISSNTGAVTNDITIETGASLDIESGGSLIVSGVSSGSITYNRSIEFVSGNLNGWYLIASPLVGQTFDDTYVMTNDIAASSTNRGIAWYNTGGDSWDYLQGGGSGIFNTGQGYSIKRGSSTGNISFTGTLNTNNSGVDIVLSTGGNRFNLLGNPYTSYIDSNTFLNGEAAISDTKTIWVWNQTIGTHGEYEVKTIPDAFVIAPSQGFFVQANSGGGTFNFEESNQSHHGSDTFQRNSHYKFKLHISDGTIHNYATVFYLANSSKGFDTGYDGQLFEGIPSSFAVYTHLVSESNGRNFQTQSLPNFDYKSMIIPVGVTAQAGSEITFTTNELNLPTDLKVFLEDRESNTFTRLDETGSNYTFTLHEDIDGIGRFYLHTSTSSLTSNDTPSLDDISIYSLYNSNLRITGLPSQQIRFRLFSIQGKELIQMSFQSNGIKDILLPKIATGVYIAYLETEQGTKIQKIILK